ncbi:MAG: ferritin-like domain-containing protein [Acidimicrobiales bacterium]|jgi:hypothetical protein|nr:ferritin-like domain-containing protein [Acidimicrobiales bacterium]
MTIDLPNDEIRRQLRAADREQQAALPTWRRAVRRAFDPASGTPADERDRLLGLPTRRTFLTGGAVVAAGGLLVACGGGSDEQVAITGSIPAAPDSSTTTAPGSPAGDVVVLSTAQSLELLAVDVYQAALDSGLLETAAIIETAELFQSQHVEHGEAIGSALVDLGEPEVTEPNQYLLTETVTPALDELSDEMSVVALALAVENIAASTYVKNTPALTVPALRQAAMSIGGVEARHMAVLRGVLGTVPVPGAFFRTGASVPEKALIT